MNRKTVIVKALLLITAFCMVLSSCKEPAYRLLLPSSKEESDSMRHSREEYLEVSLTDLGTLEYLSYPNPDWTKEKDSELKAFSLEKAEKTVRSGFTGPIYRLVPARFGLDAEKRLYLEYSVFTSNDTAMTAFVILE